jgi:endonuclease/exonuclease/phosphatase family metal-dependent hydrolase
VSWIGGLALLLAGCGCQDPGADSAPGDSRADSEPYDSDSGEPVEETGEPWGAVGLLSLNLHCLRLDGTDFRSNTERFEAIAAAVAAEEVRVIALQELCVSAQESAPDLLEQALEQATGQDWSMATAFAHIAWEGTDDEAEELVGLAVQGGLSQPRELVFHVQEGLRRVGVQGLWDAGQGTVAISSVHLDHQHEEARLGQARQAAIEGLVTQAGASALVAGDFNAQPGQPALEAMAAMGFEDACAGLDDDRIDYLWLHAGAALGADDCERIFVGERYPEVSDHPGMLVRVQPRSPPSMALTELRTDHVVGERFLAIRGDQAPLSWELGWPASRDGDRWTAVFTELSGSFEYKWLIDDADWQQGENLQGQSGQDNRASVSF